MSAPGSAAHLSPAELGQRYRAARSPIARSHLQIVWLLSRGRGEREVAQVTGYGRRWVAEVVRRYDEDGPEGLGDRRRGNAGARPLLGAGDEAALKGALAGRGPARRRAVDRPRGGGVDGDPARPQSAAAARVGPPAQARLQRPAAPATARQGGGPRGAGGVQKN